MADPVLGTDILLAKFLRASEWDALDLSVADGDMADVSGPDNLRQALLLRLLTPQGTLAPLGHAEFGSRLHELVGEPNTDANRLRARAFVLAAIAQERRVDKVLALTVSPPAPDAPAVLPITVTVAAVGGGDPITLGLEVGA
jgi:phage baseplate assembly protein W